MATAWWASFAMQRLISDVLATANHTRLFHRTATVIFKDRLVMLEDLGSTPAQRPISTSFFLENASSHLQKTTETCDSDIIMLQRSCTSWVTVRKMIDASVQFDFAEKRSKEHTVWNE